MYRGTTPTHTFIMPDEMAEINIQELVIAYSQNHSMILEKDLSEITRDGTKLTVQLSQEDTLRFRGRETAYAQVRIKDIEGYAMASQWIKIPVDPIIRDGVI